jgi:phosphatidylglycerol:prolipoprotein diacylglycerol transferase
VGGTVDRGAVTAVCFFSAVGMTFPVSFHVFGLALPSHPVMETIAYTGGFQFYRVLRRRWTGPKTSVESTLWILVGAIFGALVGSKLLAVTESWPDYLDLWRRTRNPAAVLGGKTIVGGLLGGWAGVEVAKKILGVTVSTGDLFTFPLAAGMAVGRVGCFLTGLPDHTCGNRTTVPWAVDFGDGPRHPAQLYDILFLILLSIGLAIRMRFPHRPGRIFRLFVFFYCLYRLSVEFIKPTGPHYAGLSAIQWACAGGAGVAGFLLYRQRQFDRVAPAREVAA